MPNGHRASGPTQGPRYAGHSPTRMTAVSRPTRNNTSARRPELGQLSAHWRGILGGNFAAVSARRPDVAARLLSLPGVRHDGWF
jgi:hypothetical protein